MDIKDKILSAFFRRLKLEYARLEDDNGVSGFVVSRRFEGMSTLDRQSLIDATLRKAMLSPEERRRVLMIAGLTPAEYEAVGARIQIREVKEMGGGTVEVLLHGGPADAEYVRGALNGQRGVQTTAPKQLAGAVGLLMSFRAKGTEGTPLTREKAVRVLKSDPYLDVMPNA
jgi:acid stress-induced BolA-like protein IbaG/YrbA